MWKSSLVALAALSAACASARDGSGGDAGDEADGAVDAEPALDAAEAEDAAPDAADLDAAAVDAAAVDAAAVDAPAIDAATDAATDAAVDAMCSPTWTNLLVNGGFDSGVTPWTQTSVILREAGMMPFSPHAGTHAALFGASNNANDVLVQTVTVPAGATGLRVRGYQCHVTEDPISDSDTFRVTLETPGGAVLDTLLDISNSDVAPICLWQSFTWTATSALAGQTIVLRLRGRTNLAFLTRFVVDSMSLEWLGCP